MQGIRLLGCVLLAGLLLELVSTPGVLAQEFKRLDDISSSGTSYRVFAKKGEATIQVMLVGGTASGIYEIGTDIDLDRLLTLAGGIPLTRTTASESRVTVRLFREAAGERELVYEAPFETMLAEPGLYPALQEGDLVTVETITKERNRLRWQDVLSIVSSVTTLYFLFSGRR